MLTYKIEIKRYKKFKNILTRVDISKDSVAKGVLTKKVKRTVRTSWKQAIKRTGITRRTGRLEDSMTFTKRGDFKYTTEFTAPHARYQYYGTHRSRGRFLPYIYKNGQRIELMKRFSKMNLQRNIQLYGEKFVGWHPGVRRKIKSHFPRILRRNMNKMLEEYIKWLGERIV